MIYDDIFCAKFAQFSRKFFFANFCAILSHETQWVLRGFAHFFLRNVRKTGSNFWKFLLMKRKEFCTIFFAQNQKYYAKCNFMCKLTRIEILCTELDNWRFLNYLLHRKNLTKSMIKLLLIGYFLLQKVQIVSHWSSMFKVTNLARHSKTRFFQNSDTG